MIIDDEKIIKGKDCPNCGTTNSLRRIDTNEIKKLACKNCHYTIEIEVIFFLKQVLPRSHDKRLNKF